MSTFRDWKVVNKLSDRGQTNSEVHLLQKKDSDEFIVRKVIHGIDHPLYQAIFTREMRALYKLNKSENIVSIVGDDYLKETKTGEKVGVIYLEYINGVELGKVQIENLSSKEKFSIVRQLLDAIEISHSNGIIHRDINPNNIMVTEDKVVKVIDFGICKINDMINSATVFTLGTNAYSAPEVHQHSENATEKSDLYSIGAVIYYLFTGKQPPLAAKAAVPAGDPRRRRHGLHPAHRRRDAVRLRRRAAVANTFCHIRAHFLVSLLRTGIGLVLGLVLGMLILLILRACWPAPSDATQTKE